MPSRSEPAGWAFEDVAVSGTTLSVRRRGAGEPLVLVHGTGTDASTWDGVAAGLAARHTVIAYDRRGYGRSPGAPVRDYRIHIRDLRALLAAVGPAHVLGWSSGGNVSLGLAVTDPGRFRSLTLLEAPFHGTRLPGFGMLPAMLRAKLTQATGRGEDAARVFLRWASGFAEGGNGFDLAPAADQAHLLGYRRQILAELDPHPFGVMTEFVGAGRLRALAPIRTTWLLGGRSIGWYAEMARRAVRHAPSIDTVTIPGTSHLAHHERPEAFVQAVLAATAPPR